MTTENNRLSNRIVHKASIKVLTPPEPEKVYILDMRDFSESGLYLFFSEKGVFKLGDEVEVQTLELDDAPILKSRVVRVEETTGFAVEFI